MLEIGEQIAKGELAPLVGAKPGGTQCGILVNPEQRFTVLVFRSSANYPNKFDVDVPGLLLYCGTNKGQTREVSRQNLDSRLNRHVNEEIYPIYVLIDGGHYYISLGRFTRASEYDQWLTIKSKEVYRFGLMSVNPKAVTSLLKTL